MLVRVAIRLRFVKVPGVSGVRVFRDVMDVLDRETRSFEDLSNMVERKLSFMQLPSYDFIIFYVDDSGERIVVDDAYFDELLELWIMSATHRKCARSDTSKSKKSKLMEEKNALSPTIAILGCNSSLNDSQVDSDADKSTSDSTKSDSDSDHSALDSVTLSKRSATVHCTFEVEVNSLNTFNSNTTSSNNATSNSSLSELISSPQEPLQILEKTASLSSSSELEMQTNREKTMSNNKNPISGNVLVKTSEKCLVNNNSQCPAPARRVSEDNTAHCIISNNINTIMNACTSTLAKPSITNEQNVHMNCINNSKKVGYNNAAQQIVERLPLTAQNLNTVMAQQKKEQLAVPNSALQRRKEEEPQDNTTEYNNKNVKRNDIECITTDNTKIDSEVRGNKMGEKKAEGVVMQNGLQNTDKCLVHVNELTRLLPPHMSLSPPLSSSFTIRCIVMAIRFKSPRPTISIAEIELCDADNPTQQVTAITFDSLVQRAIHERLRGDGRQVLELTHFMLRRKTEIDVRYQYNTHPLQIRLDRSCKMEIVQIRHTSILAELHLPITMPTTHDQVIVTRNEVNVAPVMHFSDLIGVSHRNNNSTNNNQAISSVMSVGSVSNGGNVMTHAPIISSTATRRRTTFSFTSSSSNSSSSNSGGSNSNAISGGNVGCVSASINGVVPSLLGRQVQSEQSKFITCHSNNQLTDASTWTNHSLHALEEDKTKQIGELAHSHVSTQELRQREEVLVQRMSREEQRKDRIRRKGQVNSTCILCGLNCDDESQCMPIVRSLLIANRQNRGTEIPTIAELRHALSDRRVNTRISKSQAGNKERLVCQSHFVNLEHKSLHVIHPRCAHLCTSYQRGNEIEDFVLCELNMQICSLCGEPGATVCCYHPDCDEMYHTVCAIFSNGYVNFGQKDPYLPCAACPRHTLVKLRKRSRDEESNSQSNSNERCNNNNNNNNGEEVLHVDQSCWYDGIAFDSRVVESTDLRDPDENEGL